MALVELYKPKETLLEFLRDSKLDQVTKGVIVYVEPNGEWKAAWLQMRPSDIAFAAALLTADAIDLANEHKAPKKSS